MLKYRVPLKQGRSVRSTTTISIDKLVRLVGTPHCPALVDVRTDDDYKRNPRLIPSSSGGPMPTLRHGRTNSSAVPPS